MKRTEGKCSSCGIVIDTSALRIHHIIPRSQGGTDDLDNIQILCANCRALLHNRKGKEGKCDGCGIVIDAGALQVHHVVPKSKGGIDAPSNKVTLCVNCHRKVHRGRYSFRRRGKHCPRCWEEKLTIIEGARLYATRYGEGDQYVRYHYRCPRCGHEWE